MGLFRDVASTLLTSAAALPLAFAANILLARCLSISDRGLFALLTNFAMFAYWLTQLGWAEAIIYRTRRAGVSPARALSTGLLANGAIALGVALLCVAAREPLSHAFLDDVGAPAFLFAAFTGPLLTLGDLLRGAARALDRFDLQNLYSFLQPAGVLAALALALPIGGGGLDAALAANLLVQLALAALFAVWLAALAGFEWRVHWPEAGASLRYGWQLAAQNLLVQLHERADIFLLAALGVAASEIGLYATAVSVVAPLRLVPGAIGIAVLPHLAGARDDDAARLTAAVVRAAGIFMLATTAALAVLGPPAIPLVFGAGYAPAVASFLLLLPGVAAVTVSRVLSRYFAAVNQLRGPLLLRGWVLALNVALNLWFIPRWGISGAASASLISYSTEALALVGLFCAASGQSLREALAPRWSDFEQGLSSLRSSLGGRAR